MESPLMQKRTISGELGKGSIRTGIGYTLFFLLVMLPTVDAWQFGSERLKSVREDNQPSFGPRFMRDWRDGRPSVRDQMNSSWWPNTARVMWFFSKVSLAMFGATLAMVILLPFRGCKRFALLFGPPNGFFVMTAISLWIAGRNEIYRFEPVVVGIVASLPMSALWLICCKWALERNSGSHEIVTANFVRNR
jgi:hypothetical protein